MPKKRSVSKKAKKVYVSSESSSEDSEQYSTSVEESSASSEYESETSETVGSSEETSEDSETVSSSEESEEPIRKKSKDPLRDIVEIGKKTNGKDIREICFEDINEQYSRGKYDKFIVVIMKKNGYINCTKLCQEIAKVTGSKKELKKWFVNINSKEIIKSVSSYTGMPRENLSAIINAGPNDIRGTYVHNLLVTHIIAWLSPEFAVRVSQIANECLSLKEKERNETLLQKKDDKIAKLSKNIAELLEINKKQNNEMKKGNVKLDKLLATNEKQEQDLCDVREIAGHTRQNTNILVDELDSKRNYVVAQTGKKKDANILMTTKKRITPSKKSKYIL